MILITLRPDPNIEPGHQWLVLPQDDAGLMLGALLTNRSIFELVIELPDAETFEIPHDTDVDRNIVELINELANVRFFAPRLVQLTLETDTDENHTAAA